MDNYFCLFFRFKERLKWEIKVFFIFCHFRAKIKVKTHMPFLFHLMIYFLQKDAGFPSYIHLLIGVSL